MTIPYPQMSAGCQDLLSTTPEYRPRYERVLALLDGTTVRALRAHGAPLAREYSSWRNAKRRDGLHPSIDKFEDFLRIHGPMPDDIGKWSLDRINPRGTYCPANIRWLNPLGQTRNRTNTLTFEYYGQQIHLQTAADALRTTYKSVHKLHASNPAELIQRLESESYRLLYEFPADFYEELQTEYADYRENGGRYMRLHWLLEWAREDLARIAEEVEDHPDDQTAREAQSNAFSVLRHALAFNDWAHKQELRRAAFYEDVREAGPRPEWEPAVSFEPTLPPKYDYFARR